MLGIHQASTSDAAMDAVILESVLTCAECGFSRLETMPTDVCQFYYECTNCKTLLRAKAGDCCVFCSYGSVSCPPIQAEHSRCAPARGTCSHHESQDIKSGE